jgi:hypothetical protein
MASRGLRLRLGVWQVIANVGFPLNFISQEALTQNIARDIAADPDASDDEEK